MQLKMVLYIGLATAGLSGCSLMSSVSSTSALETSKPAAQPFMVQLDRDGNRPPIDFSQCQPGDYYKIESTAKERSSVDESAAARGGPEGVTSKSVRIVAGRIVAIDESHVVLADAMSISSHPSKSVAVPMTTKVMDYVFYGPFAPRMFKVSGVGRSTVAIPGQVTVDRDSISDLQPIDGTHWDQVQNSGQWFERVVMDFDFNVASSEGRENR